MVSEFENDMLQTTSGGCISAFAYLIPMDLVCILLIAI